MTDGRTDGRIDETTPAPPPGQPDRAQALVDDDPPLQTPPPGMARPPGMPPGWVTTPSMPPASPDPAPSPDARPRRRMMWILAGLIGAAIAGVGAWQIHLRAISPAVPGPRSAPVATNPNNAKLATPPADTAKLAVAAPADADSPAVAAPADADHPVVAAPADAAKLAAAPPADAGTPASDAKLAAPVAVKPGGPAATGDTLSIASTPPGARVFLDGSDAGATPIKLPGSPDRHTVALLLAGHELYVAQVDGHGTFQIPLKEITPTNGPAGIKVLRCKDKDRYYVFIDGKPTGQTCPTERIGCDVGPHTVEVYDVVSETRRKWDVAVKDTRLSLRVRVE